MRRQRTNRTHLRPPPPQGAPEPEYWEIQPGERLLRIFNPDSKHRPKPLTYRPFGPLMRFDHQRPCRWLKKPRLDPERAVWYGSYDDLACAVVEMFGDERVVWLDPWHLARPAVTKPLRLLDLRDNGAMRAGTVAEIAKTAEMKMTWRWVRYFYDEAAYGEVDGLLWRSAHNDGDCIILFERAEESLSCDRCSVPLSDSSIRDGLLKAISDHRMMLVPA